MTKRQGNIYVGIGGWTYEPWRGVFYPEGPAARARTCLRRRAPDLDRDQRHFLPHPDPGHVSQMGVGSAGRVHVSRSRARAMPSTAACCGSRRFDQTISQFRRDRARDHASAPCSGSSRRYKKFDESGFRRVPRTAAEDVRRSHAAPRGRGPPRQLQNAGLHRAAAQVRCPVVFAEHDKYPSHCRRHRRFRLRAAAKRRREAESRLSAEGARCLGRSRKNLGKRRRAKGPAAHRQDIGEESSRATSSSTSFTRRRCARRPRPWR